MNKAEQWLETMNNGNFIPFLKLIALDAVSMHKCLENICIITLIDSSKLQLNFDTRKASLPDES